MYHIRTLEEETEQVHMQGKIHSTMHLFIGMEDSAAGRTVQRQIVIETEQDDEVAVRPTMSMTLSADHCTLDGTQAELSLNDFVVMLEHPSLLLL